MRTILNWRSAMPVDRNALSGLLYVPNEELVRRTIDGDDTEWSESRDYVPSEGLVGHVLEQSSVAGEHDVPVFRFPLTIERASQARRQPIVRKRAASAVAALLGVSPSVLAAATIVHVAAFVALGHWIFAQVGAAASVPAPVAPPVQATHVVYVPLRPPAPRASTPAVRVQRPTVAVPETLTVAPREADPPRIIEERRRMQEERGRAESIAPQEFVFEGDDLRLSLPERMRVATLIRVLRMLPDTRLQILGAGPPSPEDSLQRGRREAYAFARVLLQEHIDAGRLELDTIPRAEQTCAAQEPTCVRGRSRVRVQLLKP